MRKRLKVFTATLCSAALSLSVAVPYLQAEGLPSQDEIDYRGIPIEYDDYFGEDNKDNPLKDYLLEFDQTKGNNDKHLSDEEIAKITEIDLAPYCKDSKYNGEDIAIKGIEVFENLERFVCDNVYDETTTSNIGSLTLKFHDLNENLEPAHPSKYSAANTNLKYVSCYNSKVTGLELKGCESLEYLNCSDNDGLTDDKIAQYSPALEYLYCSNTGIAAPNLKNNTELKFLDCSFKDDQDDTNATKNIGKVTSLDLSNNVKLEYLDCSRNGGLTTLKLAADNSSSTSYLKGNSLEHVDCHGCALPSAGLDEGIQYATVLKWLDCSGNTTLGTLNIAKNTQLEYLNCSNVGLTGLTIGEDSKLHTLDCSDNTGLIQLDLNNSTELENLDCVNTGLTELDLSKHIALQSLVCEEYTPDPTDPYDITKGTPSADSKIATLKLNRLLHKKTGLYLSDIFNNIQDVTKITDKDKEENNLEVYYTGSKYDQIKIVAKDVAKDVKLAYDTAPEHKITYTDLNAESVNVSEPDKDLDYTLARCKHLYKDVDRKSAIYKEPIIVYVNGAARTVNVSETAEDGTTTTKKVKKNSKEFIAYTDISPSYINKKNKSVNGKVVACITDSHDQIPVITNNKVTSTVSNLASVKIRNGMVTVKAKSNGTGVCYLWILDTGDNRTYECCPINVLAAPKKLAVHNKQDNENEELKNANRMVGEELHVRIAGFTDNAKTPENRTNDATYECIVPEKLKDCVEVTPVEGTTDEFIIKAVKLDNTKNKNTNVALSFNCKQNKAKIKFVMTISPASIKEPINSPTPTPAP